jgi:hypothetical protein
MSFRAPTSQVKLSQLKYKMVKLVHKINDFEIELGDGRHSSRYCRNNGRIFWFFEANSLTTRPNLKLVFVFSRES